MIIILIGIPEGFTGSKLHNLGLNKQHIYMFLPW